jgi:integrase
MAARASRGRSIKIDFRGHDLRRTAATRMASAGVPREHIAQVLNHVEGGPRATRVYDRHTYDLEKRAALQAWATALLNVSAMRASASDKGFRPGVTCTL